VRNLKLVLQREPAAFGSLAASILPVLVLLGLIRIDEAGIAVVVVAINTFVGFGVRVFVTPAEPGTISVAPVRRARARRARAAASASSEGLST
jgi:mRNA-degrading endonuclease toxin of MazEF toxin-antitoxin module